MRTCGEWTKRNQTKRPVDANQYRFKFFKLFKLFMITVIRIDL
jgi:hypothetical protein